MTRYRNEKSGQLIVWPVLRDSLLITIAVTALGMWGCPIYGVWEQGLVGQAELKRAEQNRQIKIQEAKATREAAVELAQAEIERAKGVAESNKIVADGLKGHEEYLRYLWIDKVAGNAAKEVIYVPTEANLPILEAGKRGITPPKPAVTQQ